MKRYLSTEKSNKPVSRASQRIRAILAGGLVLGVGTAVTLAAWNDSEFVKADFKPGVFGIQGSLDGTTFAEHVTAGTAAVLPFALSATALAPSEPVYAGFAVKLLPGSTNAATISITATGTGGTTIDELSYALVDAGSTEAEFGCDKTIFDAGPTLISDTPGHAVDGQPVADVFTLATLAEQQNLCFKVTPSADLTQLMTQGTVTWELKATSTTPLVP